MTRLFGAILLELAFLSFGCLMAGKQESELAVIEELYYSVSAIKRDIISENMPLFESMSILRASKGRVGCFFTAVSGSFDSIGENTFSELWNEKLPVLGRLPEECEASLRSLGSVLGRYPARAQESAMDKCLATLEKAAAEQRGRLSEKKRLYIGLSASAGAMLCTVML